MELPLHTRKERAVCSKATNHSPVMINSPCSKSRAPETRSKKQFGPPIEQLGSRRDRRTPTADE